jgi:hypothetical protein
MMVIKWPKHVGVWFLNIYFSDRHWTSVSQSGAFVGTNKDGSLELLRIVQVADFSYQSVESSSFW